jgi:hypothetical protein
MNVKDPPSAKFPNSDAQKNVMDNSSKNCVKPVLSVSKLKKPQSWIPDSLNCMEFLPFWLRTRWQLIVPI